MERVVLLGLISLAIYILLNTTAGYMGEDLDDRVAAGISLWASIFFIMLFP